MMISVSSYARRKKRSNVTVVACGVAFSDDPVSVTVSKVAKVAKGKKVEIRLSRPQRGAAVAGRRPSLASPADS